MSAAHTIEPSAVLLRRFHDPARRFWFVAPPFVYTGSPVRSAKERVRAPRPQP